MSCSIGLHKVVEGILDNKPWFSYKKDGNFGLISILDSPSKKINLETSTGVSKTVADAINTVINDGYKDIGKIAYPGFDATGRGMVKIEPTDNQLNLINATDDSKEIYELQKQVEEEAKQKEEVKPKETLSQEIQENREYFENDEPFTRTSTNIKPNNTQGTQGSLFGLDNNNLEFHINTLGVVSNFLENIGIEQRLVPEFLSQEGSIVEGALAAANFIEGTVDIIDDLEKRPSAWNKLPEEAAHFWYRLLDTNSLLKDALLTSALTDRKEADLRESLYGDTYKEGVKVIGKLALDSNGNVTSKPALSPIREEAIGQLIAEAIKRIETKNASASDYSFFKKFLEWINSVINIFKNSTQDPFEVAAMKILSSDMSDLMTWEEYRKLNNIVNFADVLTEQSVAPIDYTLIQDLGDLEYSTIFDKKLNTEVNVISFADSPYFSTKEELNNWVYAKHGNLITNRQEKILQEVKDNQVFFDRLLNKSFRKKSKFLPKTLRKYFDIIDAQNLNPLREWNISQELQQITKKLSEQEKKQIVETNGYTNIAPTLKILPNLLQKYGRRTTPEIIKQEIEITNKLVKKEITKEQAIELRQKLENKKKGNPIVLSETIKIDGAKKQELSILNGIREMIKLENPNLKSITAEEFVNEAHNWLETNYLLGFANEQVYLSYRTDQTFTYLNDRNTIQDVRNLTDEELQNLPFEERQRLANTLGLTKQNPDVYHNKVSIRFNDMSHLKSGHFNLPGGGSPSAWGNLTYFYSGKNKWKDAVLLHEIQNDNIEFLREFKAEKVDLETSLGRYLQQLNTDLLDNITQIESGGKRIQKTDIYSSNPPTQHLELNYQLQQLVDQPLESGLNNLKQNLNEKIELYKSDNSTRNNPEKAQEEVEKAYSQRRKFADFQKRGGIKSLISQEELSNLKEILNELNTSTVMTDAVYMPDENQYEPGYETIRDLARKKEDFQKLSRTLVEKINSKVKELYGKDFPNIILQSPIKPRTKAQKRAGAPINQSLNENVNFLLAFSELQLNKNLSKLIEEYKKIYIQARNATNAYNFNVSLSKITQEQYSNLIENYKYNQDLLNRLIDEQAQKDLKSPELEKIAKAKSIIQYLGDDSSVKLGKGKYGFIWDTANTDKGIVSVWDAYKAGNTNEDSYVDNWSVDEFLKYVKQIAPEYLTLDTKSIDVKNQEFKFDNLKEQALNKKAELEKNYGKIEDEVKQTLEVEMNYFTPLVHHLIQKHIKQYGKDFPMYFSGYNITKLTQGNDRTALIYAGKDEINIVDRNVFKFNEEEYTTNEEFKDVEGFDNSKNQYFKNDIEITQQEYDKAYQQATERRAKEIKYIAAIELGLLENNAKLSDTTSDKELEEGIKKLNEFKKIPKSDPKSKYNYKSNLDVVIELIMRLSNNKPIETGAIYNAMSQVSGIKLVWQDEVEGLRNNAGGYLVDLSNYNYNTPILYGLDLNKKESNNEFEIKENENAFDQPHPEGAKSYDIFYENKKIGKVAFFDTGKNIVLKGIELNESERNKGLGKAFYKWLNSKANLKGGVLYSDNIQISKDANRVWESLNKEGLLDTDPYEEQGFKFKSNENSTDTEVRKILNTPIVIEQEVTPKKDNITDDLVEIKESEVKKKLQEILKILGITIERDADLPKDTLAKVDMLQKLISFSKGELTEDNFTEEVIHLIINIIEQKDPTLYDKMISEIWKFGIYKEVLDNYKDDPEYQTKEGKPDIAKLKKEAVVKLLVAKLVDNTNINDTKNIFGALWDKVSDFITNLFSKIPAYQRDLFEEFANDIVTKDNLINKEDVDKLGDGVFYSKKMSKANIFSSTMAKTKKLFGVASVEDYHLIIPSLRNSEEIFDLLKKINEETSLVVAKEINPETGKEEEVTYYVTGTGMKKRVSTVLNEIKTNIGNYKTIDETEITAFIKEEKMKKGTEIHSTIEEIIGRHIDKETGFLKVTPEDRPQNIAIPEKYYNILEKHLKERLISYPKDTRFMVETKIVNEVYGYAGTIDFLAILPTGQVDILDWKSMDLSYNIGGKSMKREDVHALTKQVHRQQLALYKQALLSVGVKNFRQTRTIPIIVENTTKKINKSKSFEDPKNSVIRLTSLEIGNVDPNKEAKSYLLPISTSNEEVFDDITGKPISFLNALIEKLEAYKAHSLEQRAQSTTLDRDRLLDQIQRTDKTIQELRSKKTTNLLITVFEDELFNINELSKKTFSFLEDNKNLSDLTPEQQQELRLYFDKMYENHNFLSSFLGVFPSRTDLETIYKDMSPELSKAINNVKLKITTSEEKLTAAVTKTMNQVGTILGMDDNVSDIDVKSSTMINSYSLYSRPELSLQMFTRLQKMINYLKEQEVQSFDSKMEKLMAGLQSWVKTNKTNLEGVYSKVYDKVNRRLIYKYKKEYFQTLFDKKEEAIKKHRDIIKGVSIQLSSKERLTQISKEYRAYITPFIKENYDIKKYVQLYEEAYKAYKEVVDNYIFDADPFENADIQAKKLEEWEYRHNIFTNPKALQTSGFNKNELLFQTINEDKWVSDEYRELLKPENKEVFDFYNQLQDILTDAKDLGMIESLNNLPEVKNDSFKMFTYLKAGLFKNYILSKFYAFYDRFLTNTYSSQNISDPFTNKDKKKIRSKYNNTFFLKRKPLESPEAYQERYNKEKVLYDMSLSKDLFYIFSVFGHHVIEYKILKEYESRFQLLSIVENNKTKEINTDNSKGNITLPLDDSGMPYYDDNKKLGITKGDKGTLRDLNRHIDHYLYNDKLAPRGALMNIANWLYNLTTRVNLGFTYTAPLTNLVAGLTNSTLTNNTYYNSSDFQNSILPAIIDKNTAINVKNFTKLNKMFNPFVEMSDQVYTTNKYKTIEKRYINVTKASLFLYSAGDHIIQSKIIASIYYGTTIDENNNIISVEDFINNKYPDRYNLPKEERIKLAKKIDKEIKEYKKTNSLYNLVSTNSLNLDAKNNILLTSIIEDTIAKTLGNYSEQDINTFMTKWWAKFVTQHKKWLGETIATRLEPFNVNKNTNLLEWGRMRLSLDLLFASYGKHIPFLVFHSMSSVLPEIVRKSVNKNNTITLEDIAKERYKVMQVEFFKKTSKKLKVTEAEFIRFYVRQYENSLKEAKSLLALFLLAKFILPFIVGGDDDDDNKEKDSYRTALDIIIVVLTRSLREQSFVFNPEQLKIMLLQGPIPTIGTTWNLIDSYINAPIKEIYFTLTEDDEALKTNRVIDKQLNTTPAKNINKIVKQISPSYRKLLDARRPKIQ
jgi:hypothetical protein